MNNNNNNNKSKSNVLKIHKINTRSRSSGITHIRVIKSNPKKTKKQGKKNIKKTQSSRRWDLDVQKVQLHFLQVE